MKKFATLSVCVCALLFCCVGCGGGSSIDCGRVTGTVTLDGQPLEDGTLTFLVADQRDSSAKIVNGEIVEATTLKPGDGVPLGKARVGVYSEVVTGTKEVKGDEDPNAVIEVEIKESRIPAKYNSPISSGLEFEIKPGDNVLTIELQSK